MASSSHKTLSSTCQVVISSLQSKVNFGNKLRVIIYFAMISNSNWQRLSFTFWNLGDGLCIFYRLAYRHTINNTIYKLLQFLLCDTRISSCSCRPTSVLVRHRFYFWGFNISTDYMKVNKSSFKQKKIVQSRSWTLNCDPTTTVGNLGVTLAALLSQQVDGGNVAQGGQQEVLSGSFH